jgi:RNA polymerase sigma-70 factor (ECF subfamily)
MHREAAAALRAAVRGLPDDYREAYLLWVHERLRYTEIARILTTTAETARWRVCQARKLLVVALKPYLDPPTP